MCVLCALAVLDHAREKSHGEKEKNYKKKAVPTLSLLSKTTRLNPDSTRSQEVKMKNNPKNIKNQEISWLKELDILHAKQVDHQKSRLDPNSQKSPDPYSMNMDRNKCL
jgi:hypothetical protein